MKYVSIIIITLILSCATLVAQDKRAYQWSTTLGAFLDFTQMVNSRPTLRWKYTIDDNGKTGSTICDSASGKVLFKSNGARIFDSNMAVIQNGDTLIDSIWYNQWGKKGNNTSQGDLLLPVGNKIYYFNLNASDVYLSTDKQFDGMYYHIIDPQANGGAGAVISKKNKLISDTLGFSGLQAIRHANGRDWWLFKTGFWSINDSLKLYRWLISDTGVGAMQVIKMPPLNFPFPGESNYGAGIQFNELGTKMLIGRVFCFYMADFNRCSGTLKNVKKIVPECTWKFWNPDGTDTIQTFLNPGDSAVDSTLSGLCYSPNGRYIYVIKKYSIWQWDWADTNKATAWTVIRSGGDTNWLYANQYSYAKLGPDNRIYIGIAGLGDAWQVIDSPDVKGFGCALKLRQILVPIGSFPVTGFGSPSNTPNYKLGKDESLCWPLDVGEMEKTNDAWSIYPNPTQNSLTVLFTSTLSTTQKIEIYNMQGQLVQQCFANKGQSKYNVYLQVPNGIYIVKINNECKRLVVE
jgi:hypothetical protein